MQSIELAGKAYPIQFGYGALLEYEQKTGKSAVEMAQGGNVGFTEILTLIACGLSNGAEMAGSPHEFTAKQVGLLLDATENSPAVIEQAMSYLQASFAPAEQKKTVRLQPTAQKRRKTA